MSKIERFEERVQKTLEAKKRALGRVRGAEAIGEALDKIKSLEKTLSWMPKPHTPGNGTVGESTKRMSRGGKP